MTRINSIGDGNRYLQVRLCEHPDYAGQTVVDAFDNFGAPGGTFVCMNVPTAKLLAALNAVPRSQCEERTVDAVAQAFRKRAEAAEAKLARVRELLENADADDLKVRFYNRLQKALADPKPFALPTEVPARIVAVKSSTGEEKELTLFTDGDTTWWADIEDWGPFWTRSQVMADFTDHRLIEAAG
jgi:hypothetical protein